MILVGSIGTIAAQAQPSILYQAPTGPGGTWNLYEYVLGGTTFANAQTASDGIANPLGGPALGYLVEIGDTLENSVVNNMTYRGDAWIGLTDRVGIAGATEGNFKWTNGAPLVFTNYNTGEPNDAGGEDAIHITGGGGWNDNKSGYGLNLPVADPSNTDETAGPSFRYLREWNTASATPLAGVRSAAVLSFPGSVAAFAPASTPGAFGVREVTGLTLEGNVYDTVNKVLSGAGTIVEAQRSRLDATDPETNAGGGPVLSSAPLPFLSNTGGDDNNIITIANGKVSVPSSGLWTIQVRSDDGFALRVKGQSFTSVNGLGQIDPIDPSTIFFYGGTGDANTRGVLNLSAGVYDIEFVNWEGGGGAYYEVTTAKGSYTDSNAPCSAMGSTANQTITLTGPAGNVVTYQRDGRISGTSTLSFTLKSGTDNVNVPMRCVSIDIAGRANTKVDTNHTDSDGCN